MLFPSKIISRGLFFLLISLLCSCDKAARNDSFRERDFNADWICQLGEIAHGDSPDLDESGWKSVHLPHDWSIEDYTQQDSLHQGPFYKNLPGGRDVGYLRDGIAWYRKEYRTPEKLRDKHVILDFDGIQTQMELWVNGIKTGEHVYGYTPFKFDITSRLNDPGVINIIAIKTLNKGENSRWFAGAGIYRPVHISILNPVSIAPWGVQITTRDISEESARININVRIGGLPEEGAELECRAKLISPEGKITVLDPVHMAAKGSSAPMLKLSGSIKIPRLWSTEQPDLYRASITLHCDGRETDRYETTFGIRSIGYSAEGGLLLNGKEILMKGACMHHDNGLLGAAAFPDAEFRRVRVMKENGFNAIRCSHNPPSVDFLDACDKLGMLVIDEAFDHWVKPKRPGDYSNYFPEWHKADIQAMVYRDRNHPSVIMWSYGNEIQERADPEGIEIGKKLITAIRELDQTRPVTQAICEFWDNPGKEWDHTAGAFEIMDICAYNYQYLNYEPDHIKYPDRVMYGAETVPQHVWENWEMVKKHAYVIGDFVWTGMDYIGESGIGHVHLSDAAGGENWFLQPWPWYLSWCGDIDILGNKKPQSYYRDVVWGESKLEIMVSKPVPEGKFSRISYWGWNDELNSWNWEGEEGKPLKVKVYSSLPEVRLELNGRLIGSKKILPADRYIAEFEVNYMPGELRASGVDGEKEELVSLKTTEEASQLILSPEIETLAAQRNSLLYIPVEARDIKGVLAINDDSELEAFVSGEGELLAAGNASPLHDGSFTDGKFKLFRGKGLIIVRSTGAPGEIIVELKSKYMDGARLSLEAL